MTVIEKADKYHQSGFNCAQSVLCACSEYTGLNAETGLAIAGGFGGGLRCGEVCGCVSGAVMAAGLCCPFVDANDLDRKEEIAFLSRKITGEFNDRTGHLRCCDLKGKEISCDDLVKIAAEIAENTIKELIK